jgi:hypothetical protein
MIDWRYTSAMTSVPGEDWEMPPVSTVRAPVRPEGRARAMGLAYGVEPPMTQPEYEAAVANMARIHGGDYRPTDPHRCVYNEAPKHSGVYFQCETVIADPREIRYCMAHAKKLNYPLTPEQRERLTKEEARIRLQGLSSRAVATLEAVMGDPDAPAGVRAKAATDVLDRTGFHAKAGLDVQVEAVVVDLGEIIRQRLEAKRAQLQGVVIEQMPPEEPA